VPKPKRANWELWRHMLSAELWQAVALSLNAEPESLFDDDFDWRLVDSDYSDLSEYEDFNSRVRIAANHVVSGRLPATRDSRELARNTVLLADVANWAESRKWDLPPQFPRNLNSVHAAPGSPDVGRETSAVSYSPKLVAGNDAVDEDVGEDVGAVDEDVDAGGVGASPETKDERLRRLKRGRQARWRPNQKAGAGGAAGGEPEAADKQISNALLGIKSPPIERDGEAAASVDHETMPWKKALPRWLRKQKRETVLKLGALELAKEFFAQETKRGAVKLPSRPQRMVKNNRKNPKITSGRA
jgi:hypothetical protein